MSPKIVKYIFYIGLVLAFIWHFIYLSVVLKIHENVSVAFGRAESCKIHQIESETVRYAVYKILKEGVDTYKMMANIFVFLITSCIIIALYFIYGEADGVIDIELLYIVFSILAGVVTWIDAALIYTVFNNIMNTNMRYEKARGAIIKAFYRIQTYYPMYQETKANPYPKEVNELYNIILKRWVQRNNEATIEEGKGALVELAEKKKWDIFFEYINFDVTYKDREYLIAAYKASCEQNNSDECEIDVNDLTNYINTLQSYLPIQEYKDFRDLLRSYYIYGFMLLIVFAFPIFHILYTNMGAGMLGILAILGAIVAAYIGYFIYSVNTSKKKSEK